MTNGGERVIPLCVDLDGTLLRTDTTWEAVLLLLRNHPASIPLLPFWALRGKLYLKEMLAKTVVMDVRHFPLNEELYAYLKEEAATGRPLVLVTGAAASTAKAVQEHLGIFPQVLATGEGINLTGRHKAKMLVERYGEKGFDYVGNAAIDLKVWPHARHAIVVNAAPGVFRRAGTLVTFERQFLARGPVMRAFLRAVRPHQWMKNTLILVPVVTAHQLADQAMLARGLLAFVSFCFCTSSVYLLNDLLDLSSDRQHPRKRFRPLASGDLPIPVAVIGAPLLLLCGIVLALLLPPLFQLVLLSYFLITFAYSWYLKQLVLVDVFILAALYTVRIIAGHAATGIPYSLWLLMFSLFFFLSLALVKRFSELESMVRESRETVAGRGYLASDRVQVAVMGSASGYISALILALYVTSEQVTTLYTRPALLWIIIPLMLFWISRMWMLASRGMVHEDPIVFTLKDGLSYLVGSLIALVMFLAT